MAEKRYNVIFSGKLAEGIKPAEVLSNLCSVLQLEQQEVRELFKAGAGTVIRQDLEGQNAYKLRDELQEAGAICTVQDAPAQESSHPASGPAERDHPPRRSVDRNAPAPSRQAQRQLSGERKPSPSSGGGSGIFSILFKIIVLAAIGGGGWWGYQTWLAPPSPAYEAYVLFSESMARGQYQKAADAASGQAKEHAESWIRMTAPSSMKLYGKEFTMSKPSVSEIAGDIAWIKRKRKLEKKKDDGVILQVEETVCRIPPGVSSALCKWPVTFLQDVEVSQVNGEWKVSSFKDERLTPMP
jgi:hypothetical protein